MADPFSLATGVISLVAITLQAIAGVCRVLDKTITAHRAAGEELEQLRRNLEELQRRMECNHGKLEFMASNTKDRGFKKLLQSNAGKAAVGRLCQALKETQCTLQRITDQSESEEATLRANALPSKKISLAFVRAVLKYSVSPQAIDEMISNLRGMQAGIQDCLRNLETSFKDVDDLHDFFHRQLVRFSTSSRLSTSTTLTARVQLVSWLGKFEGQGGFSERSRNKSGELHTSLQADQIEDGPHTAPLPSLAELQLDAEMVPAPPPPSSRPVPITAPRRRVVSPAVVQAAKQWRPPPNTNSDTSTGGRNVGHYFVPPKGSQTDLSTRTPSTSNHGQPSFPLRPPPTAKLLDSAKDAQAFVHEQRDSERRAQVAAAVRELDRAMKNGGVVKGLQKYHKRMGDIWRRHDREFYEMQPVGESASSADSEDDEEASEGDEVVDVEKSEEFLAASGFDHTKMFTDRQGLSDTEVLDAEMILAPWLFSSQPAPITLPLKLVDPPALVQATKRWRPPQNTNSDTGTGGRNAGLFWIPPKGSQTDLNARTPPTSGHGQPPFPLHPPPTAKLSDWAKDPQPSVREQRESDPQAQVAAAGEELNRALDAAKTIDEVWESVKKYYEWVGNFLRGHDGELDKLEQSVSGSASSAHSEDDEEAPKGDDLVDVQKPEESWPASGFDYTEMFTDRQGLSDTGVPDAEMIPTLPPPPYRPTPITLPLKLVDPPVFVQATKRWRSLRNTNYDTGTGGRNVGHYFVLPKKPQTDPNTHKPSTSSHGEPPFSMRPPPTATQSDWAKHQRLFAVKLPEWQAQVATAEGELNIALEAAKGNDETEEAMEKYRKRMKDLLRDRGGELDKLEQSVSGSASSAHSEEDEEASEGDKAVDEGKPAEFWAASGFENTEMDADGQRLSDTGVEMPGSDDSGDASDDECSAYPPTEIDECYRAAQRRINMQRLRVERTLSHASARLAKLASTAGIATPTRNRHANIPTIFHPTNSKMPSFSSFSKSVTTTWTSTINPAMPRPTPAAPLPKGNPSLSRAESPHARSYTLTPDRPMSKPPGNVNWRQSNEESLRRAAPQEEGRRRHMQILREQQENIRRGIKAKFAPSDTLTPNRNNAETT